jgi:AraC-like DNA-binding protein
MDDNFCFNLKMEEFAKITARSLSAFKRDFMRVYGTTPGKWLMEKRLNNAFHLLTNMGKTVSEVCFESGFESTSFQSFLPSAFWQFSHYHQASDCCLNE